MKKVLRLSVSILKWIVLVLVAVEVLCFLVVCVGNYLVFGHLWEGSRVRYDPYALFLNVEGPRPTAQNPPPGQGTTPRQTLWLLGGSTMRGSTDHDDRTIPSYLAEILNRPGSPVACTVVNYGENSFNSLMETKYLQKLLIEQAAAPDLIIFYDGGNDCSYFTQHRTPDGHYGYRRLRAAIESYRRSFFGLFKPLNAALYSSFTKELYDKAMQTVVPIEADSPLLQEFAAATAKRYEHVRRLAGAYGARFLLCWQPILWVETGAVAPPLRAREQEFTIMGGKFLAVRQNFAVTYQALAAALQDRPYFVNFQNILCARTEPVYKADGVHLTDAGRSMVAREMGRVLQERRMLEK